MKKEEIVPYPRPNYKDENLFIKELVNGSFLKAIARPTKKGLSHFDRYNLDELKLLLQLDLGSTVTPSDIDIDIQVYDDAKLKELAWLPYRVEEDDVDIAPIHDDYARFMRYLGVKKLPKIAVAATAHDCGGIYMAVDEDMQDYLRQKEEVDAEIGTYYINLGNPVLEKINDTPLFGGASGLVDSDGNRFAAHLGAITSTPYTTSHIVMKEDVYQKTLVYDAASKKAIVVNTDDFSPYSEEFIIDVPNKFKMLKRDIYITAGGKNYIVSPRGNIKETKFEFDITSKYDFLGARGFYYYLRKRNVLIKTAMKIPDGYTLLQSFYPTQTDDILAAKLLRNGSSDWYLLYYTNNYIDGNVFVRSYKIAPTFLSGRKYPCTGLYGSIYKNDSGDMVFEAYRYKEAT